MATRFWEKVNKTDTCWLWTGSVNNGYGWFHTDAIPGEYRAHRISWIMRSGDIPADLWVLHQCDIPICVNPDHLFLGTPADNVADKIAKGRQTRGNAINGSRFSESVIREIRRRYDAGEKMLRLAHEYDVSFASMWSICRRKTWKHIV